MDVGLQALGAGSGAERTVIDAVAAAAERAGFAALWIGEQEQAGTASLDPFVTASFAAAATTGIQLIPRVDSLGERDPVDMAKQIASLERLCGGRLAVAVTAGDSAERSVEYTTAMRTLWRDDIASFRGEFVQFDDVRSDPKPLRRAVPVVFGGVSQADLERAAHWADGWHGHDMADVEEAATYTSTLRRLTRTVGRDPGDLRISVALRDPQPGDVQRLADAGVDEMVLVADPPGDPIAAEAWVGDLARQWMLVLH